MTDPCTCLACQLSLGIACKDTEARIRADARRFLLRELQALAADLGNPHTRQKAAERLATLVEAEPPTETVGEPPAQPDGPPAANVSHLRRENEQLRQRNEVLQAEVRRLRARLNAEEAA